MVLPRDTYAGPVLAGQRWRNRGQSGHDRFLVTVIRLASNSVQVVVEGAGGGGGSGHTRQRAGHTRPGKRYNVPLDIFRNSYILVSQPKGYREPTALDEALAARQIATTTQDETPAATATSTAFGAIYSRSALVIDPVPAEHLPEVIETISAARTAFANPPEEPDPMPETPPEAPSPLEAPIAPPDPEPADPEALFATAGEAVLDRLEKQIAGLTAERKEYTDLLADLNRRLDRLHDRRADINTAVLAVIGALQEGREAVPVPPEPPEESVTVMPIGITEPTAPPEGRIGEGRRLGQREFLTTLLRGLKDGGHKQVTVAELAVAFAREFEVPQQRATMNVSSILVDQMKRATTPGWPPMLRTGRGVYAFLG